MLALSSTGDAAAAVGAARRIDVQAYTLPDSMLHAVEAAAHRGAAVTVHLEGSPYEDPHGGFQRRNQGLARELRAAGAQVTLGHLVHSKEIVADGVLYLDERNWCEGDLVLREDDPARAAAIPSIKHEALAVEARLLDGAERGDAPIVQSESFGSHNAVYSALARLAAAGTAPRLLISKRDLKESPREERAVKRLVADGVRVRVCSDSDKLAVAGNRAWLGSANATIAAPDSDMSDWGLCTSDPQIVRTARARVEAQWDAARDFRPRSSSA